MSGSTAGPTYREHPPHPGLAGHVACYWTSRGAAPIPGAVHRHRVVPDGCTDFLIDYRTHQLRAVGTMTRPLEVAQAGPVDVLGIRFRPGALPAFLDTPLDELTDRTVDLADAGDAETVRSLDAVFSIGGTAERLAHLDRVLGARLSLGGNRVDTAALHVAALVGRSVGRTSVAELAEAVGLGRRQLERRFRAAVGVSPGVAGRVTRFQAALRRLHAEPGVSLSRAALDAGYYDQAHFTREFRALAGEPPGAYRRRRRLDG